MAKKFDDMCTRLDTMPQYRQRDGRTDGRTEMVKYFSLYININIKVQLWA